MNRVALLVAACCALAACSSPSPATTTSAPPDTSDATGSVTSPRGAAPGGETVELVDVIDGDTIEVETGTGVESVRLIGINAPESDECFGDGSHRALELLLAGTTVTLEPGTSDDRDGFNRLLRYVIADETDLNAQQLRDGNAFVLQSEHDRLEAYVAIAAISAESGAGLWKADRCGGPPGGPLVIAGFDANPPGPDDDPDAGEYVTISHAGDEPWDLGGWILRDESSIHRYEFPDVDILPSEEYIVRTGCGTDRRYELFWCAGGPVWSNHGDTIILLDPAGNVVDHLTYRG
jgi:endonuclease YncB( thermonuclease family)